MARCPQRENRQMMGKSGREIGDVFRGDIRYALALAFAYVAATVAREFRARFSVGVFALPT